MSRKIPETESLEEAYFAVKIVGPAGAKDRGIGDYECVGQFSDGDSDE